VIAMFIPRGPWALLEFLKCVSRITELRKQIKLADWRKIAGECNDR
jgi:hypothetical protein